ncbi:MAG: right-handed parallel beta-helix repeat-containing protein, partial [Thermoplasmata archaeon]|nr:right-handed parallel beta-helix repeat-containing protein [Thermoplasmata archaeon]
MAVGAFFVFSAVADAKTIIVDDDWAGANYSSIREAVDAASDGDTIRVYAGMYNEDTQVNKRLDIIGNGTDTIINGTGKDHTFGFSLMGGGCNVSGFQFYYWWPTHEFGAIGIYSDGNRVFDNLFYFNARGTFLDQCKENHIFNNTFHLNTYGVFVTIGADDTNISFNTFTEPRAYGSYGILYGQSSNYTIFSNTFHNYTTSALGIHRSDNVTISFNMFEASPLEEGKRIGSMIYACTDTDVHNNTFLKCEKAVSVGGSINTVIEHNSISNSTYGVWVYPAGVGTMNIGTEVHFNNIFDNAVYGIDATTNTAAVVNATHNWWGDPSGP